MTFSIMVTNMPAGWTQLHGFLTLFACFPDVVHETLECRESFTSVILALACVWCTTGCSSSPSLCAVGCATAPVSFTPGVQLAAPLQVALHLCVFSQSLELTRAVHCFRCVPTGCQLKSRSLNTIVIHFSYTAAADTSVSVGFPDVLLK